MEMFGNNLLSYFPYEKFASDSDLQNSFGMSIFLWQALLDSHYKKCEQTTLLLVFVKGNM